MIGTSTAQRTPLEGDHREGEAVEALKHSWVREKGLRWWI